MTSRFLVSAILFLGCGLLNSVFAAAEEADIVKQTVEENVAKIVSVYEERKPTYETDPEGFYVDMERAISAIIDFRRIAARVMGKYAKKASKAQRDEFVDNFKTSLFKTYTKTIIDQGSFEIKVVKATINTRSDRRAAVDMEFISDSGKAYPVTYSMYKNKSGQWMMENVIVFGINIGLAFKDKFEAQMREQKGDIQSVIANWTVDLDIEVPEEVAAQEG